MSQSDLPEVGLETVAPTQHAAHPVHDPGRRRAERKRRSGSGCLPILLVMVLFCAVIAWFARGAIGDVKDMFAGPEDYPGPGTGEVEVVIDPGQSIRSMGNELKELDVVASSDAFVDAASANNDAQKIQAATYVMKLKMKAADAVAFLANPANAGSGNTVTVPEGARVGQVVETIVKKTDFTEKQLTALLDKPGKIGLPAEAGGNPEGYLFPATYEITETTTAQSLLSEMVAQTEAAEKDLQIAAGAERLGLTAHEIITVASILEYEANRGPDYPKVARVIYNRLDDGMALQLDSTVSYASKRKGDVWTTADERDSESLYNTYKHTGLPPGPIGSPGKETIEAALNPADGNWLYFVPDFEKGTTLFTDDYDEHLRNAEKAKEYCRTHDEC
ncbi:endolytic transglycosylase MltG [Nocardioides sp. GCM10030258]|uniref:endolytic transglycosylase MltG n=1 Tax=unclassified Nocardioides TaxID=2615069 RepID=UPI003613A965